MSNHNAVNQFMVGLEHPLKTEIEAIRATILSADRRIGESIKWNAPSFYIEDHFATLKLRPAETVQVVLHRGAKAKDDGKNMEIKDPSGLLKWAAKDRCVVTFDDAEDVESKKAAFAAILKQWIKQL